MFKCYAREFKLGKQDIEIVARYFKIKSCVPSRSWVFHCYRHSLESRTYGLRLLGLHVTLKLKGLSKADKALAKEFGLDTALGVNCD